MVAGRFLFVSILALSQSALGLAVGSGADGIISSINTISNECVKLNSTLNEFTDNAQITATALKLQGEASDLLKDIKNGAEEASKVSSLEAADQEKIANAIVPLSDNVVSLINGFVAKKPAFQKAVLGGSADGLVEKDLQDLKEATDSFGQAALKSFSGAPKEKATSVLKGIDEHFADAIKTFST
ncbi:hydrophobic surface binding protein A domain-containing protein [Penicillium cataractarum]|uniref:Hydrophobic surface binding protein A domain-containing protein n=1 Tax=Penicillium cataractarum TaxID=2100454 RepID=A0A9W9SQW3_9EURO|nr:hydrophobic surface binding protein A domain-containing protein [Penicillium cataractarum]KAJ5381829.1 hydrophobic surface binding protein A domain-containing protein [Penicillium cataractarum]